MSVTIQKSFPPLFTTLFGYVNALMYQVIDFLLKGSIADRICALLIISFGINFIVGTVVKSSAVLSNERVLHEIAKLVNWLIACLMPR